MTFTSFFAPTQASFMRLFNRKTKVVFEPRTQQAMFCQEMISYTKLFKCFYSDENLSWDGLVNGRVTWPDAIRAGIKEYQPERTKFSKFHWTFGNLSTEIFLPVGLAGPEQKLTTINLNWYESSPTVTHLIVNGVDAPDNGIWWQAVTEVLKEERARLCSAAFLTRIAKGDTDEFREANIAKQLARAEKDLLGMDALQ